MILKATKQAEIGPDDRAALKQFLDSRHGKNVLDALGVMAPEMSDTGAMEVMIATGQQRKGFEKCIECLLELIAVETPPPDAESTAYPSLDDDEKWKQAAEEHNLLQEKPV